MQESPGRALKLFWAHLAGLQMELKYFWPIHCLSPPPTSHAFWLLVCFYFPYTDFYLITVALTEAIKGKLFSPFAIIYAWLYGSVLGSPLTLSICEKHQVSTAAARTEQRQ